MLFRSGAPLQGALFPVFGANTPGPEFRGILRERGRRSLTRHAQGSDRPLGAHTSPRRSGKADHGSRVAQPQRCALAGARGYLRAAGGGNGRAAAHGGADSAAGGATFERSGGARRAEAGAGGRKSRTRGGFGGLRGVCGRRGSGQNRGQAGLHPGARRAKNGQRRDKTGCSGGQKGGYGGRWGQKSPFLPRKRRATGLCWGENWREKLAGRVGLFGTFRESSGGFGGKVGGFEKPFPRAYRKELPRAPFLCRWRTVIGADNLVVPSGCYLGRKE